MEVIAKKPEVKNKQARHTEKKRLRSRKLALSRAAKIKLLERKLGVDKIQPILVHESDEDFERDNEYFREMYEYELTRAAREQ